MSGVVIYSSKVCPNCNALKQYMDSIGVKYKSVDMGIPEALTELCINGVYAMSAPVLQVGNKFYNSFVLFSDNKLNREKVKDVIQWDL